MVIRAARIGDIENIMKLAAATWYPSYGDILSKNQIDYMLDLFYSREALTNQMESGHYFLILSDNGQDVGFASFEPHYKQDVTKLHKLYILPQQQGSGGGRLLISAIESHASANADKTIMLNVNRYNKAVNFYHKNGFEITGTEDINIGQGYLMEDYTMAKNLQTL